MLDNQTLMIQKKAVQKPLIKLSLKKSLSLSLAAFSMTLGACSSQHANIKPNKPLVEASQIYLAPAQTYNLDLNSPALAGKLDLRNNCSPEGNSLSITDQIGRFYRIDAINLNNNPKFPAIKIQADASTFSQDYLTIADQLAQYYATLYQAQQQGIARPVRVSIGESAYVLLNQGDAQNAPHAIGLLIHRRGQYAYVIQHTQTTYNQSTMIKTLTQLAKNMQIPGRQLKKDASPLVMDIDLAQATPAQLSDWKKTAHCS